MMLDYFYGQSGELFAYFRIPKALFQDSRFRQLSTDARTLYGILLDRMSLSAKNSWVDLCRVDSECGDFRRCHQFDLGHCRLHRLALFQSVQNQLRDEICSRSALKGVLYWLRIFLFLAI